MVRLYVLHVVLCCVLCVLNPHGFGPVRMQHGRARLLVVLQLPHVAVQDDCRRSLRVKLLFRSRIYRMDKQIKRTSLW